jgi:hypothetical protein
MYCEKEDDFTKLIPCEETLYMNEQLENCRDSFVTCATTWSELQKMSPTTTARKFLRMWKKPENSTLGPDIPSPPKNKTLPKKSPPPLPNRTIHKPAQPWPAPPNGPKFDPPDPNVSPKKSVQEPLKDGKIELPEDILERGRQKDLHDGQKSNTAPR